MLAEALRSLPDEFKLAVAGDGPGLEGLRAELPGRVHYAGLLPKDELWGFYAALDCLAVPSLTTPRWKEQLGGTLLDGLAMGVPVVASASGGLPDAMGEAGILVPEGDAAALAGALRRLREDEALRERLARARPRALSPRVRDPRLRSQDRGRARASAATTLRPCQQTVCILDR